MVDLDRLLESRLLIQANSGAGKSRLLRSLLEETHGRIQQVVIDPEGEFASLRERFDYLHVGAAGASDLRADPEHAGQLCRRVMELGVSVILDLQHLQRAGRQLYVARFLEALMELGRESWRPLLVAVDELSTFAPERSLFTSTALEPVVDLVERGRKRGYCLVAAVQRLSHLNKGVAAPLRSKLIGWTDLDVDVDRACRELGFRTDRRDELKELPHGDFFAYGSAFGWRGVRLVHVADSLTTHPQAGRVSDYAPPPAPAAIQALLERLQDLPDEEDAAPAAAGDDELRAEVGRLQTEIRELRERPAPPPVIQRVEVPVLSDEHVQQLTAATEALCAIAAEISAGLSRLQPPKETPAAHQPAPKRTKEHHCPEGTRPTPVTPPPPKPFDLERSEEPPAPAGDVAGGAVRMLQTLARLHPTPLTRAQLGRLSGLSHGGGTFGGYLRELKARRFLDDDRGRLSITRAGLQHLGAAVPSPPRTSAELQALWQRVLPAAEWRMVRALLEAHPRALSRRDLAKRVNLTETGGTFGSYVRDLRGVDLVEVSRGAFKAGAALFLNGKAG